MKSLILFYTAASSILSKVNAISILLNASRTAAPSSSSTDNDDNRSNETTAIQIKSLAQIGAGPLGSRPRRLSDSIVSQYQQIGITHVRTHDFFGAADMSIMFPDFSADAELEESYDFGQTDLHLESIVEGGMQVLFRLGESANSKSKDGAPSDIEKWAQICKHIVLHYNYGWADGYHFNISYWEVWNEPDLTKVAPSDYYTIYNQTVTAIKGLDPNLKVGGPTIAGFPDPYPEGFTTGFLQYLADNELELDFFSWHSYPKDPKELYDRATFYRNLLDDYGFNRTQSFNTEWNIWINTNQRSKENNKNGAFTASCLMLMQESVDMAYRYRGTSDASWLLRLMGYDLSLFWKDGRFKIPALSHLAMKALADTSSLRLETPGSGPLEFYPVTYLAAVSEDGSTVNVLLSNFNAHREDVSVRITDLPFSGSFTMARYVIDRHSHFEIDALDTISSLNREYSTSFRLKRNAVVLLHLTSNEDLPPEGPRVKRTGVFLRIPVVTFIFQWMFRFLFILI